MRRKNIDLTKHITNEFPWRIKVSEETQDLNIGIDFGEDGEHWFTLEKSTYHQITRKAVHVEKRLWAGGSPALVSCKAPQGTQPSQSC